MENFSLNSFDNHTINCYLFEVENPIGVIQICHGMKEHAKRYFNFCEYLNKHNFNVLVSDSRGHGEIANKTNTNGFSNGDIFEETLQDQLFISKFLKEKYENLKLYFLGHSYGSFIGQAYIKENQIAEKIILIGSSYNNTIEHKLGKMLASLIVKFKGKKASAKMIENLSFKSYGKKFKNGNWLSVDEKNFDKYQNDELCGNPFPASFYKSMFSHTIKAYKNLNNCKKVPLLILAGNQDPVGKNGKLVIKLSKTYSINNFPTTMKLYKNKRHEILNDLDKHEVYNDIKVFITNPVK